MSLKCNHGIRLPRAQIAIHQMQTCYLLIKHQLANVYTLGCGKSDRLATPPRFQRILIYCCDFQDWLLEFLASSQTADENTSDKERIPRKCNLKCVYH